MLVPKGYSTSGPASRLPGEQKAEFVTIVEASSDAEMDGVVRWRRVALQCVIQDRFGVEYHERHVGTFLKKRASCV